MNWSKAFLWTALALLLAPVFILLGVFISKEAHFIGVTPLSIWLKAIGFAAAVCLWFLLVAKVVGKLVD